MNLHAFINIEQEDTPEDIINRKYFNMFEELNFIAKGGFGSCSTVIHLDSGLVIVRKEGHLEKMKNPRDIQYMENEATILKE